MSGIGGLHIGLKIVARNPCSEHGFVHSESDACQKGYIGTTIKEEDLGTVNFTSLIISQIFNTATTGNAMKGSNGTPYDATALMTPGTYKIGAGSGTTTCYVDDYTIQSEIATDSPITATITHTVTKLPGGGPYTSSTTTVTGTFTNSTLGVETYGNIGIYVIISSLVAGPVYFLLAHDLTNGATGYPVSPSGTVLVTYTIIVN